MKTAERILMSALELFNARGVASVTTNAIADSADISIGNLYYYFQNKEAILLELLVRFQSQTKGLLDRDVTVGGLEDWVQWWKAWFEQVETFEFLFRDQSYLLQQGTHIRHRYSLIVENLERKQRCIFDSFKEHNTLVATKEDVIRLAKQVTLIALFWQDFRHIQPRHHLNVLPYAEALEQTLGLLLPYLPTQEQLSVEHIIRQSRQS